MHLVMKQGFNDIVRKGESTLTWLEQRGSPMQPRISRRNHQITVLHRLTRLISCSAEAIDLFDTFAGTYKIS
jgi:hypothetical protein